MLQKVIIACVILAAITATFTSGLVSALFAFFAFSLLVYFSIQKNSLE